MDISVENILSKLDIKNAECIYLHCSIQGLGLNVSLTKNILDEVLNYFGNSSTVFVPTFPFAHSQEYINYVTQNEIKFDSVLTPCKLNLIGELFRRKENTIRSLHPIMPISGIGPLANEILSKAHIDELPFGPNTFFSQLRKYNSYVVGLGVNVHTNSFIHVIDDILIDKFPYKLYSNTKTPAKMFVNKEPATTGSYYYILSEIRRRLRPEKLHDVMKGKAFYKFITEPYNSYSVELNSYINFGVEEGMKSFEQNALPVWH